MKKQGIFAVCKASNVSYEKKLVKTSKDVAVGL